MGGWWSTGWDGAGGGQEGQLDEGCALRIVFVVIAYGMVLGMQ